VTRTLRPFRSALFVALWCGCSTPYIPDAGKLDDAPKTDVETPRDVDHGPDAPPLDAPPIDVIADRAEVSVDARPSADLSDVAMADETDASLDGSADASLDARADVTSDGTTLDVTFDASADVRPDVSVDARLDVTAPDVSAPDVSAPDVSAPDVTAPDVTAPDVTAPDVMADVVVDVAAPPCVAGAALIAAGSFMMGSDLLAFPVATPVHRVSLSAFCLDVTEVTVAAYAACVGEGRCTRSDSAAGCNELVAGRAMHPINCVDWTQARAYCQSRGGELPTEAQWEFAARGTSGRTYPWGNTDPAGGSVYACWSGGLTSTCAVHAFPMGDTPTGVADLAGNVREWVLDWYATTYPASPAMDPTGVASGTTRVRRGGSWVTDLNPPRAVNAAYRGGYGVPTERVPQVGFRCVYPVRL
jgi:formylglycine-generating enzyme